jgi:hypothetical protein
MTDEKLIRMAREAGFDSFDITDPCLERFAALVAAAEREACAELMFEIGSAKLAAAIRARGTNETK